MTDILIIGAGPAGISAALYAARANKTVEVLCHGDAEVEKAVKIDNYYGFPGGITGTELYRNGIAQAKALGVTVTEAEALGAEISMDMTYLVKASDGVHEARSLIIASGSKKLRPNVKGVDTYEGKGISYCAVCDGFFYRKKRVAVVGNGPYAVSEAGVLRDIADSVTILTNGQPAPETDLPTDTRKIAAFTGELKANAVVFADGDECAVDGIFIALGEAGGADFAKKLGAVIDGDKLVVDENMATNLPGLFACGNVTGGLLQVCKAVHEGAVAGLAAVKYVKSLG